MRTHSLSSTVGAATDRRAPGTSCPAVDRGLPRVWVASWTLLTLPPNFHIAERFDNNVAKVEVLSMIPLPLQPWVEAADDWTLLLLLRLLLHCGGRALCGNFQSALTTPVSCIAKGFELLVRR